MKFATPALALLLLCTLAPLAHGNHNDPCGMVPPIYTGEGSPITRQGLQKTYVFYKDGVETFVIRPGFKGKVDEFGMLIPFPTPPAIRKVPDHVFDHISNAIDPPEVVIDLRPRPMAARGGGGIRRMRQSDDSLKLAEKKDVVRVIRQEAVGMYEVAVLEAGSAKALKKWMEEHKYVYPKGMDDACEDYVESGWCFVAVKTKVGPKMGVDPGPGRRRLRPDMPKTAVFDGAVQGMGFRFETEELVVPMRLSTFNGGDLRNIVYLLTDGPKKIRSIPEEYVQRQLTGKQLVKNLTDPLPLRIIGGTEKDLRGWNMQNLKQRRDPDPKMKAAKELFAGDLFAVESKELSLIHEEAEKELLRIGEHFGLRGGQFDSSISKSLDIKRKEVVDKGMKLLENMTMTVVDGDFPRDVLSSQNLKFAQYKMPSRRNNATSYDAKEFGPGKKKQGVLKTGQIIFESNNEVQIGANGRPELLKGGLAAIGLLAIGSIMFWRRPRSIVVAIALAICLLGSSSLVAQETSDFKNLDEIVAGLKDASTAKGENGAIAAAVSMAKKGDEDRSKVVKRLVKVAKSDDELSRRGWAIAALAEIGGSDVDEELLGIHSDEKQKDVVKNWAAAARVKMTRTLPGLLEKAQLIQKFPALGRPIGMRIVEAMAEDKEASAEDVLKVTLRVGQLRQALAPSILAFGPEKLTEAMVTADDVNVRRQAAAYLGTLYNQGKPKEVVKAVVEAVKFDAQAEEVPWDGGALFIPGIRWGKEDARALVGHLVRWHLWSDIHKENQNKQQIHNNIRSLGLARAAGYQSPGWNNVGTNQWLIAWGKCMGKDEIKKILEEQDVLDKDRYSSVLSDLE